MKKSIPRKMHVFINKKCNMRCKYCYWPEHPDEEMSEEIANRVIEYVIEHPNRYDYIVFFGGEPMLSPHLIQRFIQKVGHDINYIIMTNGTVNPGPLLDALYKESSRRYNICFTVSYEGFSQEARQSGTNKRIEETIRFLRRYQPKVLVTISSVFSPYNYKNIARNMIYFYSMVDSGMFIRICDLPHMWKDEELEEHIADYPKFVDILTYYQVVKEKTVLITNRIDRKIEDEGDNYNGAKGHFCHNSLKYSDVVGVDGKKYLCEVAAANGDRCYGYLWEENPSEAIEYNTQYPAVHHHKCIYYDSQHLAYDGAMDKMRERYQRRKEKLERLKTEKQKLLLSKDIRGRLWRLANDYYRK